VCTIKEFSVDSCLYRVCCVSSKRYRSMFTGNWWINVITPCTIIVTIAYYFCVSTFKKWENLNVPYIKPIPFSLNFLNVALGKEHHLEFYNKFYQKFAGHKYAGVFQKLKLERELFPPVPPPIRALVITGKLLY